MAEKGIFNKEGLTPLESVYRSSIYDVMQFISIETAEETYKAELQEAAHDRAMKKQKRKR